MSNDGQDIIPVHEPQRSDIISGEWPFDRDGRWVGTSVERIEEDAFPFPPAPPKRPNAQEIDQRRRRHRRSTFFSSLTLSVRGESQLLVPSYFPGDDQELMHFHRYGPPSQPPMEIGSPHLLGTDKRREDPPAEGVLAWLHCLAGFLVVLNAQ